ncbi:MAG: ABC transporter permease [Campylobacteraceae bacterium]
MRNLFFSFIGVAIFLVGWQYLSSRYSADQLPPPLDIYKAAKELIEDGVLVAHFLASMKRFFIAYFIGAIGGIVLGLLLGRYTTLFSFCDMLIQILRPISPIAWFPLAVLWFGIGDNPAIFIIIIATFFPVLLSTIAGVRNVDKVYLKVSENFGASEIKTFFSVIVPAAFPHIVMGLNLAMGIAWINLVAGEMLGAQSGLGYIIVDARNMLRVDLIILGMVLIGLTGLVMNIVMKYFEKMVKNRWGA